MAITDQQYLDWLRADNKQRCVLIEAQAYSGGATVTRYMSNMGFVSAPTDSPANTAYDDIVLGLPGITSAMSEVFRGRSTVGFGDIEIDNSGGARDAWALDAWDGRPVSIFLGDPSWPKADFRLSFSGTLQDIFARGGARLVLRLRDRQQLLDVPVQTSRFASGPNANAVKPICYGEVFNITPVLEDAATRLYRVHDGAIDAVPAVYVAGVPLTLGSQYTVSVAAGTISLLIAVTGQLTADVRGSKTGGTYVNKTADIVSRIAQERAGLSTGDIDAAAITAMNTDAPGAVGLYVSGDGVTVRAALDTLITGAAGFYTIDRDGKLTLGLFKAPAGTPELTLVDDDIAQGGIEPITRIVPTKSVQVGYARNWTVMSSGLGASVSEARQAYLAAEFASVERATSTPTGFLLATDGAVEPSCFVAQATAASEATRRATLWGSLRRIFRLRCFLAPGRVRIGSVLALELGRFGLAGPALANVVGIRESLTGGWTELEVFL